MWAWCAFAGGGTGGDAKAGEAGTRCGRSPREREACDVQVHRTLERRRIDADLGGPSALVAMVTALASLAGDAAPVPRRSLDFSASGCVSEFG